jgi:hypothetical protein
VPVPAPRKCTAPYGDWGLTTLAGAGRAFSHNFCSRDGEYLHRELIGTKRAGEGTVSHRALVHQKRLAMRSRASTSLHHHHLLISLRNMTDGLADATELKATLAVLAGQRRLRPSGWQIELQVASQSHRGSPSSANSLHGRSMICGI